MFSKTRSSLYRISHLRHCMDNLSLVPALGPSSLCIRRWHRKKITRCLNAGRKKPMEFSFLWVLVLSFIPQCTINCTMIDRSILCGHRCVTRRVYPGPQTKLARYLCILSCEHLSSFCGFKRHGATVLSPFHCRCTTPVLSSEICRLGELTLGFELGDQPYWCSLSNIVTAMGASIHQVHSTRTVQTREASTNTRIFCQWCGQDAPFLGS